MNNQTFHPFLFHCLPTSMCCRASAIALRSCRLYFTYFNISPTGQWSLPKMSLCMDVSAILSFSRSDTMK